MKKFHLAAALILTGIIGLTAGEQRNAVTRVKAPSTPIRAFNNHPAGSYAPSAINARFNISVKDDTKTIKFVRDTTNPYVITKAYELKYANPFAVRYYLRQMVIPNMVKPNRTNVDALQFMDGKGLVIVSAEEYRFADSDKGDGFDTIIRKLDRKELGYFSDWTRFVYFPKIGVAANLKTMVEQAGAVINDSEFDLTTCSVRVDPWLNALMYFGPPFEAKNIYGMLKKYDVPVPEVRVTYRVLELYKENDDKVGLDFQGWKNNDGMDFFKVGGRYRRNWSTYFTGGTTPSGRNKTSWLNFNPKWNTRYVDLTNAKSNSRVLTSGTIVVRNREATSITINTGFFADRTDAVYWDPSTDIGNLPYRQTIAQVIPADKLADIAEANGDFVVYTYNNARVLGQLTSTPAYAIVSKAALSSSVDSVKNNPTSASPVQTMLNTNYVKGVTNSSTNNGNVGLYQGKPQYPVPEDGFQFVMDINPVVAGKASTLDLSLRTISLMGYNSDGTSRRSTSNFSTNVQVGYDGEDFVIGGLSKSEVVRSVSGLPWLKNIPILGYLVSDESESIKRSQIIVVLSARQVSPDDKIEGEEDSTIGRLVGDVDKGLKSPTNNLGFQQLWIDTKEIK